MCDLENIGHDHDVQHSSCNGAIAGKYITFCLSTIVMFTLFLFISEIFANIKKIKSLALQMKVKVKEGGKRDLRHSTVSDRFHIVDFFSEFQLPGNILLR